MRSVLVLVATLASGRAHADQLPPGSLGLVMGGVSGTNADSKRIGFGYYAPLYPPSFIAAWQPMSSEQRVGWAVRWSTLFGTLYTGNTARITTNLLTIQMDLTLGIRVRPGVDPSRYVTLRAGAELFRTNQEIPPINERAFFGPIASVGFEQYKWGFLFDFDLQYGLIAGGPQMLAFMVGASITGP
ncbi:MAG: hypothetical protein NT062_15535 [Proteobacteria bacterium]|nr:hypothetical protein [Pseudomonadota bacterium]